MKLTQESIEWDKVAALALCLCWGGDETCWSAVWGLSAEGRITAMCTIYDYLYQNISQHVICTGYIDGLVQERCNSSTLAMELHLSCTSLLIWWWNDWYIVYAIDVYHISFFFSWIAECTYPMRIWVTFKGWSIINWWLSLRQQQLNL